MSPIKRVSDLEADFTDSMLRMSCDLSQAPDDAWRVAIDRYTIIAPDFQRVFVAGTTLVAEAPARALHYNLQALTAMIDACIWWTNLRTGR